jgi:hypothetical protein
MLFMIVGISLYIEILDCVVFYNFFLFLSDIHIDFVGLSLIGLALVHIVLLDYLGTSTFIPA